MKKETAIVRTASSSIVVAPASHRIEELIDSFILSQDAKQSSKGLYRRTLKLFFAWVNKQGYLISELSRPQIIEYKEALLASGMSGLSVSSYISSVRRFYEWAEANKYYFNIAKGVGSPKRRREFKKQALTPEQSKALLSYYESQELRDYAIVSLLLRTGLRTIEVIRANVEDIRYKSGKRVLYIQGKGRDEKDAFVVLTDKAYVSIEKYLESRGKVKTSEPLFTSTSNNSSGERLTTRSISRIAKEGLKAIGLNSREFTAHSLRHSAGTNILRAGGQLTDAQVVLRHSSPDTTMIYVRQYLEGEKRMENAPEELLDNMF